MKKIALIIFALLAFSNYSLSAMDAKKESASAETKKVGTFPGALTVLDSLDRSMKNNQFLKMVGAIKDAPRVASGVNTQEPEIMLPFDQSFLDELIVTCDKPYTPEQIQKIMMLQGSSVYAFGIAQGIRLMARAQEQREASDDK